MLVYWLILLLINLMQVLEEAVKTRRLIVAQSLLSSLIL